MADDVKYTPQALAAAAAALRGAGTAPVPAGHDLAAGLAARQAAGPAGVTDVDVSRLLAGIAALQDRVDALEQEKTAGAGSPLLGCAQSLAGLIAAHAAHTPGPDYGDLRRLADEAVDAAGNAAESGDGSALSKITQKISAALKTAAPGPGDHPYYRQAVDFAGVHLPAAAQGLTPRQDKPAPGLGSSRGPATVVQGSVTG